MGEPAEELDAWDFDDAMLVDSTRTGGGILQQPGNGAKPVVYLELDGDTGISRHVLGIDEVLKLVVQLEHAGKTAMLMEHVLPR